MNPSRPLAGDRCNAVEEVVSRRAVKRQHVLTVVYAVFFVSLVLAGARELIGSIGGIDDVVLVGIRAAIIQGKAVAILTDT